MALLIIGYNLNAQSPEVGGRIRDFKGEPIPGVNILVKGTPNGAVTNPEGYFKIKIPYGSHVLTYSFIGYKSIEQKIHVNADFFWNLDVTMVTKGSKGKGSTKFVEREVIPQSKN